MATSVSAKVPPRRRRTPSLADPCCFPSSRDRASRSSSCPCPWAFQHVLCFMQDVLCFMVSSEPPDSRLSLSQTHSHAASGSDRAIAHCPAFLFFCTPERISRFVATQQNGGTDGHLEIDFQVDRSAERRRRALPIAEVRDFSNCVTAQSARSDPRRLRPFGPSVTLTTLARMSMPHNILSRRQYGCHG